MAAYRIRSPRRLISVTSPGGDAKSDPSATTRARRSRILLLTAFSYIRTCQRRVASGYCKVDALDNRCKRRRGPQGPFRENSTHLRAPLRRQRELEQPRGLCSPRLSQTLKLASFNRRNAAKPPARTTRPPRLDSTLCVLVLIAIGCVLRDHC